MGPRRLRQAGEKLTLKTAAGYRVTDSPAAEADTQATLALRDFVCPIQLRQAGEKLTLETAAGYRATC